MKQTKLFLTTIVVLLCSVMANAYDFEVDGIYYNILSSTDLTAAVTHGDNKYTGDVIIPSTVNYKSRDLAVIAIGWGGFSGCTELNSITIPNSVKSIGGSAFEDCSSLISITIPDSVTSINSSTFEDCSSLTSIIIPNGVITIGGEAFSGCSSLTNITIPNSVISIGEGAFNKCTSLKELRIEDGDTNLEMGSNSFRKSEKEKEDDNYVRWNYYHYGLFYDCPLEILYLGRNLDYKTGKYSGDCGYQCDTYDYYYSPFYRTELNSVTIGSLVTTIGVGLFEECSNLKNITIPKNVTSIENHAFDGCSHLHKLHIEDGGANLEMGYNKRASGGYYGLFTYCPLDSLYIGRNLSYQLYVEEGNSTYAGPSPFQENSTLKSVTISDSVTVINEKLFLKCCNLAYVTIGNNVANIHDNAFCRCDSLTSITIPKNVDYIGSYAYSECSSLRYLHIEDNERDLKGDAKAFLDKQFYNCPIEELYLGRNTTDVDINLNNIKSLTIGNPVTNVDKYGTFNSSLETITLICSNPPVIARECFLSSNYVNSVVYVPQGTLAAYQVADVWKDFWDIQEYILDKKFCVNYYIDGEFYAVDSVKHGDTIIPRAEPKKENYEFSGWSDIPETMPAHDVTITGTFIANTYTITYMVDNEIFAIDTIAYGDTIIPIAELTTEGYTFSGWSNIPETMPAEDIVVTGMFVINTYTITYVVDSVVYATDSITYGDTIILLDEPTQEGYTFSGWSEVPEIMPAEDITIEGTFNVNYYALKYIVDNEPFATDSLAYGDTIILREEPQKEDFEFSGWSEAPETMPAHDVEVYGNFIFTSVTDVKVDPEQSQKVVEDNQLFIILPNGRKYNVIGQEIGN